LVIFCVINNNMLLKTMLDVEMLMTFREKNTFVLLCKYTVGHC